MLCVHAGCARPATHSYESFPYCARHAPRRADRVVPLTEAERLRIAFGRVLSLVDRIVFLAFLGVGLVVAAFITLALFDPTTLQRLPSDVQSAIADLLRRSGVLEGTGR